jgi:hypothetical protein
MERRKFIQAAGGAAAAAGMIVHRQYVRAESFGDCNVIVYRCVAGGVRTDGRRCGAWGRAYNWARMPTCAHRGGVPE